MIGMRCASRIAGSVPTRHAHPLPPPTTAFANAVATFVTPSYRGPFLKSGIRVTNVCVRVPPIRVYVNTYIRRGRVEIWERSAALPVKCAFLRSVQ